MEKIKEIFNIIISHKDTAIYIGLFTIFAVISIAFGVLSAVGIGHLTKNIKRKTKKKTLYDDKPKSKYFYKLRASGILYHTGEDLLIYNTIVRGFSILMSGIVAMFLIGNIKWAAILGIFTGIFLTPLFSLLCIIDNREAELDMYSTLTYLRIGLLSDSYFDDIMSRLPNICISERYKNALNQLIADLDDKSKTTADAINNFKTYFSGDIFKEMCDIIFSFISYGKEDLVFKNIDETCEAIIKLNSHRLIKKVGKRYDFSSAWIGMASFTVICIVFFERFANIPVINDFIIRIIYTMGHLVHIY